MLILFLRAWVHPRKLFNVLREKLLLLDQREMVLNKGIFSPFRLGWRRGMRSFWVGNQQTNITEPINKKSASALVS
ncbi:hypothetical protein, partial [Bacillus sp. JJ1609]|uniref:hypothetical protein n=1 Tax=Bacillus sp. JJ1609 TaxID=3122977 RepID=UPI0030000A12